MNAVWLFSVGIALTILISLAVVTYLKPHLQEILVDLCGTVPRAAFWTAFSSVMIALTPVVFAMHYRPDPVAAAPFAYELGSQLEWALGGLLASMTMLGFVLSRFIRIRTSV